MTYRPDDGVLKPVNTFYSDIHRKVLIRKKAVEPFLRGECLLIKLHAPLSEYCMAVGLWRPVVAHCLSEVLGRPVPIGDVVDITVSNSATRFGELYPQTSENPAHLHFEAGGLSKREERELARLMPNCCDGLCGSYRDSDHPVPLTGIFNGVDWKLTPDGLQRQWVKKDHFHNDGSGLFVRCDRPHRRSVVMITLTTWVAGAEAE